MNFLDCDPALIRFIEESKPYLNLYTNSSSPYTDFLKALHTLCAPTHYLEIGVNTGSSFVLASRQVSAHGVDPNPSFSPNSSKHQIFKITSDEYFQLQDLPKPGLVFIDGLHTARQTLVDFVNAYNLSQVGAVIAIDDVLPESLYTCQPFRIDPIWHGDVFKVVLTIKTYYSEISLKVIDCSPGGLAICVKQSPINLLYPTNEIFRFMDGISAGKVLANRQTLLCPNPVKTEDIATFISAI